MTHISYGDEPLTAEHADSWYARKTASLIARCQDNIGYLMTFAHSQCKPPPGGRTYGSDLPRSCDLRGGAHQPEARGGVVLPLLRSTLFTIPSYSVQDARRADRDRDVRIYFEVELRDADGLPE